MENKVVHASSQDEIDTFLKGYESAESNWIMPGKIDDETTEH